MANRDNVRGLYPIRQATGGKIPMNKYYNDGTTTAIFEGDIVYLMGGGHDRRGKILRLATTTGSDDIIGVAANYVAAGTSNQEVWVYDSPETVFGVNSDGSTSTDHSAHIGAVATAIVTAGNTTTGLSKVELDYGSITSTGTSGDNVFRIVGVDRRLDNDAASSHAELEVMFCRHYLSGDRDASV